MHIYLTLNQPILNNQGGVFFPPRSIYSWGVILGGKIKKLEAINKLNTSKYNQDIISSYGISLSFYK